MSVSIASRVRFTLGTTLVLSLLGQPTVVATPVMTGGSETRIAREQLSIALHVHSTLSTGSLSVDELIARAQSYGLDGIILAENYRLRFDYGLWPLRGLLSYGVEYPSVQVAELSSYLSEIKQAQQRSPRFLLMPGLEVIPHYFWTGSIVRGDLTLHNTQKNLLILGLDADELRQALTHRPSMAGPPGDSQHGNIVSLFAMWWPLLLWFPAAWLWRYERVVQHRLKHFHVTHRRRYRSYAATLIVISVILMTNAMVVNDRMDGSYEADPGERYAQAVINTVRSYDGLIFWSLPEETDFHRYTVREVASQTTAGSGLKHVVLSAMSRFSLLADWTMTVKTDPYPHTLLDTTGYTGFGAVYESTVTVTRPGGEWDQLLGAYLKGERREPVWGIGELAYHMDGRGKSLGNVQTVVLAKTRSVQAVHESLASGAFYARRRLPAWGLRLDDFSLVANGSRQPLRDEQDTGENSDDTGRIAIAGETLAGASFETVTVRVAVSATDGRSVHVPVRIIRSGIVWQERSAVTPFELQWEDELPKQNQRGYYRVEVGGEASQFLLSNPIFYITSQTNSRQQI